jgi:hypothetical protein
MQNTRLSRRQSRLFAGPIVVLMTLFAAIGCVRGGESSEASSSVYDLIAAFVATPPSDEAIVEKATGAKLTLYNSGEGFDYLSGVGIGAPGVGEYSIDFHKRLTGKTDAMLILRFHGDFCISRTEMASRYGAMEVISTPSGHGPDGWTIYSTHHPWGNLNFGFLTSSSNCAGQIVFHVTHK